MEVLIRYGAYGRRRVCLPFNKRAVSTKGIPRTEKAVTIWNRGERYFLGSQGIGNIPEFFEGTCTSYFPGRRASLHPKNLLSALPAQRVINDGFYVVEVAFAVGSAIVNELNGGIGLSACERALKGAPPGLITIRGSGDRWHGNSSQHRAPRLNCKTGTTERTRRHLNKELYTICGRNRKGEGTTGLINIKTFSQPYSARFEEVG
jgi:hypothetical protein